MFGPEDNPDVSLMGIIPRSVSFLFNILKNDESISEFKIKVSFLEIYKEEPRDLLNTNKKGAKLKIRMNKRHETYMQGLIEKQVNNLSDVLKLIAAALFRRTKAATQMNATSSRSHMLMRLTCITKTNKGQVRIGVGNFADLAGSEDQR